MGEKLPVDFPVCRLLPWDSDFFGVRIGRIAGGVLDEPLLAQVLRWSEKELVDCLYFLSVASDARTTRLCGTNGFCFVDTRVTYERSLNFDTPPGTGAVRTFAPADLAVLRSLAAHSHHDSRFYFDEAFDRSRCDELYATWIEQSCEGSADRVFVAEMNNQPAGYVTCHLSDSGCGSIGLLAVSSQFQGGGLGKQLVRAALSYFHEHGMNRCTVVTQARNIPSQRLYQRCGFLLVTAQHWYHCWFTRNGGIGEGLHGVVPNPI